MSNDGDNQVQLGLALHKKNRLTEAKEKYLEALALNENNVDALHFLSMIILSEGDRKAAIEMLEKAIAINPENPILHNNLGDMWFKSGDIEPAERCFTKAVELSPDYLEAKFNLSNIAISKEEYSRATDILTSVVDQDETFLFAVKNLIELYLIDEDYLAIASCLQHNLIACEDPQIRERLIFALQKLVDDDSEPVMKIEWLLKLIQLGVDSINVYFNLANTYKMLGELEESTRYYQIVLSQDEHYFGALVNLGVVELWLGHFSAALSYFEKAKNIRFDDYILLNNLGMTYHALQRIDEAEMCYEKAVATEKNRSEAYWNWSLLLLLKGEYEKGWQYYEHRWELEEELLDVKRKFNQPKWCGENIAGKTLFVYCEQGYGDAIQFFRFVDLLSRQGVKIILECPPALKKLFENTCSEITVQSIPPRESEFDVHCALMSLPLVMNITLDDLPMLENYIGPEVDGDKCIEKLGSKTKIGVVWSGNPRKQNPVHHLIDKRRSIPLVEMASLFDLDTYEFYSLQKDTKDNIQQFPIKDRMDEVTDFSDTANLIAQLDLVISVDTAVAHLAAAMGKPVWVLSRLDGCWRWLLGRDDSPWYPSVRIFRQTNANDWKQVIKEVRTVLEKKEVFLATP